MFRELRKSAQSKITVSARRLGVALAMLSIFGTIASTATHLYSGVCSEQEAGLHLLQVHQTAFTHSESSAANSQLGEGPVGCAICAHFRAASQVGAQNTLAVSRTPEFGLTISVAHARAQAVRNPALAQIHLRAPPGPLSQS